MTPSLRYLSFLFLTACAAPAPWPAVPPPAPPPTAAPPVDAEAGPTEEVDPPVGPPIEPFELAWSSQSEPFNRGLALSDEQLAVLSTRQLALYSLRGGELLAERASCPGARFVFVGADRGALTCADGLHLLRLPSLQDDGLHPLPAPPRWTSVAAGRVALAFAGGPVRVLEAAGLTEVAAIEVTAAVTALQLGPRGQALAVGLADGDVLVVDLQTSARRRFTVRRGSPVDAVSFAPAGGDVFAVAGPTVGRFGADGKLRQRIGMVSGIRVAQWLGTREVVTAGREGLLSVDVYSGALAGVGGGVTGDMQPVSMVASASRGVVCSATLDGMIACLSRGALAASPQMPLSAFVPEGKVESAATVSHFQGKQLSVAPLPREATPAEDARVTLLRFTKVRIGGNETTRWVEAASCRVVNLGADEIELSIESRPEGMAVPLEPFAAGDPVKLRWPGDR